MALQLIPIVVGVAVTIMVLIAIFSVMPNIIGNFKCPTILGDLNQNYIKDNNENWTDPIDVQEWKKACSNLSGQSVIVPTLLVLAVIISVIIIIVRLFA